MTGCLQFYWERTYLALGGVRAGVYDKFKGNSANHWRQPVGFDVHRLLFLASNVPRRKRRGMLDAEVEIVTASPLADANGWLQAPDPHAWG